MTEIAETTIVIEPRKLGLVGKAIVALMVVVTAGLVVGAVLAFRHKRIEDADHRKTLLTLESLRRMFHDWPCLVTEARQFATVKEWIPTSANQLPLYVNRSPETDAAVLDGWGHPIRYACPGPAHKNGFDLISCGPNGVYEEGGGDDIVVGEDLPGGIASIESGR